NDLVPRLDSTSVTGLRLNLSEEASTQLESEALAKLNELVGFGIFSPITVAFDAPLDLDELTARHLDDFHQSDAFDDDVLYVINVEPNSPDYLQPVAIDMGHGRFPMDVADTNRYFPNDPRFDSPSLFFETVDEDLNGNGVLDIGEDTDNDGVLDVPNVHPADGDPRADLLTFYDVETDTLYLRPVVPLREQTRYAVVLTERLVGEDGHPIQSPWKWVNHTRQTPALEPVLEALPQWGLAVEDVAYAWVFTTGRVTGDLVDIHRGLVDSEGPWSYLSGQYPAGVTEALSVHEKLDLEDRYRLPIDELVGELGEMGLFDEESGDVMVDSYLSFSGDLVSGVFETPYLLADRDDAGRDDSDEWWQLNPAFDSVNAEAQRVPFTCVLPLEGGGFAAPYPVVIFGHGYRSSRLDFLGFAYAFNRLGFAACAMDFPTHGLTVDEEDVLLVETLLEANDLMPFLHHLRDARHRDLDNDGVPDSGGDQWSADLFHTRDVVRQAVVDWMQLVRSLKNCGKGRMQLMESTGDGVVDTYETRVSCDWDDDGEADMGGDVDYYIVGGSLGGINTSVAAAVMPEITAWTPIVAGGGLLDLSMRTEIGGAVEAMVGTMLTPMFVGYPNDSNGLDIVQVVSSVTEMVELPVATISNLPGEGSVVLENLSNGEVREGWIPADGRFRLSIPADAVDAFAKRMLADIPEAGPEEGTTYEVADNAFLGDLLRLRVYDKEGDEVADITEWEQAVLFEGVTMAAGSPLVAGSSGLGHIRGSAKLRKVVSIMAMGNEAGDAVSYAPHWFQRPFDELGGDPINLLLVPTPGDTMVPISAGISLARSAGLVPFEAIDERYGTTIDAFVIDRGVVQGLEEFGPYTDIDGEPCLFDVDDLDRGTDGTGAPSDEPLRVRIETSAGVSGMRLPYVDTEGSHGFGLPDPKANFDINTFAIYQVAHYFASGGQELLDKACFETADCDDFRPFIGEESQ
ncbi:MAG: hypothetical protein HN348_19190, partial [Proteobacteria bacterium]|nr:hypothetical protein [Pseudomonadota bacterium]